MTNQAIFIQVQGKAGVTEAKLPLAAKLEDLIETLKSNGVAIEGNTFVALDEDECFDRGDQRKPIKDLKPGTRIHVTRCRRIATTVHYLEKAAQRDFPPGTRLRTVKAWVVREFKIEPKDAGEHVLRVCNSTTTPSTDTPLHELVGPSECSVCFDLVPDKRVEG